MSFSEADLEKLFSPERYNEFASKISRNIKTIGYSEKGAPIHAVIKGSGKIKVLFIARIHGNEPATTQAQLEFLNELRDDAGFEFHGIFLANPDGAALYNQLWLKNKDADWKNNFPDARLNANKQDINRDWFELSQPETKALCNYLLELRPDFVVDMHEYFWSDKGYPPKYPTDDEDGFMATMTDAPFNWVDGFVKDASLDVMNYLIEHLEKEFEWKINRRHFAGNPKNSYNNPDYLGIYVALRGIPKLLIETWGVGCSTLLLDKRIAFHKRALELLTEWLNLNTQKLLLKAQLPKPLLFDLAKQNIDDINEFTDKLKLHKIEYSIDNNKNITIYPAALETGFINTVYHIIFEKEDK